MAKDMLNEFGPNSPDRQAARATSGGVKSTKPLAYSSPQGPTAQMQSGPGLHGSNSGNTNQPTGKSSSGRPGLGGTIRCSQGRH